MGVVQKLARHATPQMTMNVYTRLGLEDLADAVDRLTIPDSASVVELDAATGTDGDSCLFPCLFPSGRLDAITCDNMEQAAEQDAAGEAGTKKPITPESDGYRPNEGDIEVGDPTGIRTRVSGMRVLCPGPD